MAVQSRALPDPLFQFEDFELVSMWDEVQSCQVDFGFSQELAAFYTQPLWHGARQVLDVGTGNGDYLRRLAKQFPEKEYTGIDISRDLIEIARRAESANGIRFEAWNFTDLTERADGQFDFILARLFMQHLDNIEEALSVFAQTVPPGGGALIIDSHDDCRCFWPDVPAFWDFFNAYKANQDKGRRNRDITSVLPDLIAERSDWSLVDHSRIVIPATVNRNLDHYRNYYHCMLNIVERVGLLDYDLSKAKAEWAEWCRNEQAYTHLALDLVMLQRL